MKQQTRDTALVHLRAIAKTLESAEAEITKLCGLVAFDQTAYITRTGEHVYDAIVESVGKETTSALAWTNTRITDIEGEATK